VLKRATGDTIAGGDGDPGQALGGRHVATSARGGHCIHLGLPSIAVGRQDRTLPFQGPEPCSRIRSEGEIGSTPPRPRIGPKSRMHSESQPAGEPRTLPLLADNATNPLI
jgi:hypothetical protein